MTNSLFGLVGSGSVPAQQNCQVQEMKWIPMSERDLKRIEVLSEVMPGRRTVAAGGLQRSATWQMVTPSYRRSWSGSTNASKWCRRSLKTCTVASACVVHGCRISSAIANNAM